MADQLWLMTRIREEEVIAITSTGRINLMYRFGPRFPCMTNAYDRSLRLAAWRVGRRLGFEGLLHEGVSVILCGPSYETPAELRMMRALGADVVGKCSMLSSLELSK